MMAAMDDLWSCPDCGRRFVNANQWHSCGNQELADVLEGVSDRARAIYDEIETELEAVDGLRVHPQKTRIAFITRMTFAGVRLARRWVDLSFIIDEPVDDPRIRRIDLYGPTSFAHEVRLEDVDAVDADVKGWLARSVRRGDQETLDRHREVAPVVGRPLELLHVPLRTVVAEHGADRGLTVPGYVVAALEAHPRVTARIGGTEYAGVIEAAGERGVLLLDVGVGSLGLDVGDATDAFLTAEL